VTIRSQESFKIKLAFGSAVAILLVVGAVSYRSIGVSKDRDNWVQHTHEILSNLQELRFAMQAINGTASGFALTGNESDIEPYHAAVSSLEQHQAAIRTLTVDNPEQQRQLPALEILEAKRIQRAETIIGLRRTKGLAVVAEDARTGPSQQISTGFQAIINQMQVEELRLLAIRNADAEQSIHESLAVLLFGTFLGALATAAAGWAVLRDSARRGRAEQALHESEARLDRAQAIAGIGSWELEIATGRAIWSKELYRIRGVSPEDFDPSIANGAVLVHPDDHKEARRWMTALAAGIEQAARETRNVRPDGELRLLRVEGRAMTDPDGLIRRLVGTMQDITDHRLIEQQLTQARKMEAIGNLTGGMAHDFNNGLGVIVGNLDLLGDLVKADQTATELCDEARDGALRCADRIRLLLAFARRQALSPQHTDVNALAERTVKVLGRTLSDDIALTLHLDPTLPPAVADPAQLEAALTNLTNNARDAMPKGGRLDITTKIAELDAQYAALHPGANPGMYVLIEVSDTGVGMAPEIIDRIFEPFFTTKEAGLGTGLGLSMVFGFAKQSGGHLAVYSEPGLGSTFRIYLPRTHGGEVAAAASPDRRSVVGGSETVLVVEDNAPLRLATGRQLAALGYQIREAAHGAAALVILSGGDRVDLLFTDVAMPGTMDGRDLALQAMHLRRGLKVLLTSGFLGVRGADQRMADRRFPQLSKPYGHDELARMVREVLDRGEEQGSAASQPPIPANRSIHDGNRVGAMERV
jgi:PAS domain S-box-containing protein